jgi:hypothetical protein
MGQTLAFLAHSRLPGGISSGAIAPSLDYRVVVIVGSRGAAFSPNEGRDWLPLDTLPYSAVAFADRQTAWMIGPHGRVVQIQLE